MTEAIDFRPALISEFGAMRNEITTFISLEVQFLNLSVLLAGVLAGIAANKWQDFSDFLALCPIPFLVFALLYADVRARILRAAFYIHNNIRPHLLVPGADDLITWEKFIRDKYPMRGFMTVADRLRWLVFLLPALSAFLLSIGVRPKEHMNLAFWPFLLFIDSVLFLAVIWSAFNLAHHEKGLQPG
ncbi:MAG TPA: hypothetical protein VMG82_21000 [Candidatus Sulfotelmatobacter sp.]|nr:hypothetical protein [Candidatus Sulfotelmatobacter sp.]